MICKAILEVIVEDDLSVTSRVLGTPNLSTDFKNLYLKLHGIAERDECGIVVLKDLIALGDSLSKEVTS